jgi:hypothetical protein
MGDLNTVGLTIRDMRQVQKLHIATEQLEDALKAYFDGRFHSAVVLAGAAEQLLAGYVAKHGLTPAWSQMRTAIVKIANVLKAQEGNTGSPTTEKDIGDLMNHVYNNSKHAGTKDHIVWMDPKLAAQEVIDRAITNYDALSTRNDYNLSDLPLAQQFMMETVEQERIEGNET